MATQVRTQALRRRGRCRGRSGGAVVVAGPRATVGRARRVAAKPIPRNADGTISFAGTKDDVGNWEGPPGTSLANNVFEDALEPNRLNLPTNLSVADVPFQPWARELYDLRQRTFTKDDPHTRCKPSGGARLFHTPYGFEILQLADTQEIMFLPVGSPHSWRVVHMDGRPLPENPAPSWYGTSVGRWEGDTLVIDTVGFNERFWISREGVPHTTQLRTTERISRPQFDSCVTRSRSTTRARTRSRGPAAGTSRGTRATSRSTICAKTTISTRRGWSGRKNDLIGEHDT